MRRLISNLLGLHSGDSRGMGTGTAVAGAASAVVIVAAVTAGIAVPSGANGHGNPQAQVDVVKDGIEDSLEETNQQVVNKDQAADNTRSRQIAAHVRRAIPEHAWNNLPSATRQKLTQHLGGFMSQVEAQSSIDSELMRVSSSGDGIVRGATLKQHGTGSHTITDTVTETYTTTEQRLDHWERYIKSYKKKLAGYEKELVGYEKVQVGTTRSLKLVTETYQVPVYDTRTYYTWESKTVSYRERHTRTVQECGWNYYIGEYCYTTSETYYTWETETKWYKTTETERYISHYETERRYVNKWVTQPVYEKRPVYTERPVYNKVPVYDRKPVYTTVNIEKKRTKTVQKEVQTAPFVVEDGNEDWTLATDVQEARDATMRIEKAMLTESQSNAFQLVADSQTTGEQWRMTVWKENGQIVIRTNNGVERHVSGEFAEINFDKGTINGQDANIQLANGVSGPYTLRIENGNHARGTYKLIINGDPSVQAQSADIANDEAGVTVVDGIVYSATFDVTYESGDTTYTDRVTIEPEVNVTDSPTAASSPA